MKKVYLALSLGATAFLVWAFVNPQTNNTTAPDHGAIKWYSFEEAVALSAKKPKKMFIDVYTDWCGWCKKMDQSTFTDPQVAEFMNRNFYAVKFNAEQKELVQFKGHELKYMPNAGRRGVHELAYALLDGRLGYPSFVYLDENQNRISISPGFKNGDVMLKELRYIAEGHFKNKTWEEYSNSK
ncbi:MAG TPA: DUF255 domain-containing protein [Flavilitoribacter sp.]|nr:DUF255 domain-containing protein [Lewinella sp.]MCB9280114.1 DUF255 domain-containing protein [Lewinellaceae bacterium]HMQ60609.1 DUF255 domain-containing protein [Flavilitoribacter sp.]HMQ91174.1 DUF255 domain-containing protein [Flavilitoribacter sp.]